MRTNVATAAITVACSRELSITSIAARPSDWDDLLATSSAKEAGLPGEGVDVGFYFTGRQAKPSKHSGW